MCVRNLPKKNDNGKEKRYKNSVSFVERIVKRFVKLYFLFFWKLLQFWYKKRFTIGNR